MSSRPSIPPILPSSGSRKRPQAEISSSESPDDGYASQRKRKNGLLSSETSVKIEDREPEPGIIAPALPEVPLPIPAPAPAPVPVPVPFPEIISRPANQKPNPKPLSTSYASDLGNEIIQLRVGPDQIPFTVHKQKLCLTVPALEAVLKSHELYNDVLELPDADQESVSLLIKYCYTSALPKAKSGTPPEECFARIKLYCLAAEFEQRELMNTSVDFIVYYLRKHSEEISLEWAGYAYAHTQKESPLRRLLSRYMAYMFFAMKDEDPWGTAAFAGMMSSHTDLGLDVLAHMREFAQLKQECPHPRTDARKSYHVPNN